jgi:uncharacterized OB-fold protein
VADQLSDAELVERFAHMPVDHDTKDLYRGWLDRELRLNRCDDCGRWHNPPRPMCPSCWSWNVTATPVSGRGTVHLVMRLHQGPSAEGVDYTKGPHLVVTVDLAEQEGLRFTSTVVNADPASVTIGDPVELTWIERNGGPYPVFQPASTGATG